MPKISPTYEHDALSKRDGRTKASRLARDFKADLIEALGGAPSIGQQVRANQAAQIQMRLAQMGADTSSTEYLALTDRLNRLLDELGLTNAAASPEWHDAPVREGVAA